MVMHQIAALPLAHCMSEYSSRVLQDVFGVPAEKIDLIPHGIPDLPFVEPEVYKDSLSLRERLYAHVWVVVANKDLRA